MREKKFEEVSKTTSSIAKADEMKKQRAKTKVIETSRSQMVRRPRTRTYGGATATARNGKKSLMPKR